MGWYNWPSRYARNQPIFRNCNRDLLQGARRAHFHAKYAGQTGVFSIADLELIEGRLSKRVVALVLEWAFEHRSELLENWQRALAQEPLLPIAPLE